MKYSIKYGNQTVEYEEFSPKGSNFVKLRLVGPDGIGEGIWMCITDKDLIDYKNDVKDDTVRIGILLNESMILSDFMSISQNDTYGAYIPYTLKGRMRPHCYVKKIHA